LNNAVVWVDRMCKKLDKVTLNYSSILESANGLYFVTIHSTSLPPFSHSLHLNIHSAFFCILCADLMKETQELREVGSEVEYLRSSFLNFDIEDNFMQILQKMDFSDPSRMGAPSISQVAEAAARASAVAKKEEEDRENTMETIESTLKQVDYMKECI
jgi:hypothetical protein